MKKTHLAVCGLLLAAVASPAFAQTEPDDSPNQGIEVWGALIDAHETPSAFGIYSFRTNDATMTRLTQWDATKMGNGGGTFYDDEYHFVNYDTFLRYYFIRSYCFSTDDWYMEDSTYYETESNIDPIALAIAHNPVSGKNMGLFFNSSASGFQFGEFDYETLQLSPLKATDTVFVALACNAEGQYYGISVGGGLFSIDGQTGTPSMIARTGLMPQRTLGDYERQCAAFDPASGKLYWAAALADGTRALYEVDTATAQATKVVDFPGGEMFSAICFPQPKAKAGAPAMPLGLAAQFDGPSLTGTVGFTMPQSTFGDAELSGELSYTMAVRGGMSVTGKAQAGETVELNGVEVAQGQVTIAVSAANDEGRGPRAKLHFWAGNDVPCAPENVRLAIDNVTGEATLTWDAPTEGTHQGYIGNLTYYVTRYPEGSVVGSGVEGNQFTERLTSEEPATYYYTVEAINAGLVSRAARSNSYPLGALFTPPYKQEFETTESMKGFTVVPRADRTISWSKPDNILYPFVRSYWDGKDCDDWLITPAMLLEGGRNYEFSFIARCEPSNYGQQLGKNRLACAWGEEPTAEGMTQPIIADTELNTVEWTEFKALVSPKESGVYYFGIHDISDKMEYYMDVDDIAITPTKEEVPTGIGQKNASTTGDAVYSLDGRRLQKAENLAPGIYIKNGKKFIKTHNQP